MFSVIFPGQGSQSVGMTNVLYKKFNVVKELFDEADGVFGFFYYQINFRRAKTRARSNKKYTTSNIFNKLCNLSINKKEFSIDLNKAKFFAGHSLGEYTALTCAGALNFQDTLKLLRIRGKAMQEAVPEGEGGMVAILGSDINAIEKIIEENKKNINVMLQMIIQMDSWL